mmetsp:Transcript_19383/g.39341  ORF Transcript_19383/g.39341 Transcript_19383/m.39341 type:complete len:463 (+) Transcript_19383:107-1495(+)
MRWPHTAVTHTLSSSYLPVKEDSAPLIKHKATDIMEPSDRSKLIQLLQFLTFWRKKDRDRNPSSSKVLREATDSPDKTALDSTDLLSDEELEEELFRILPLPVHHGSSSSDDLASLPQEFMQELEREEMQEQVDQNIFVSKERKISFWRRLWRIVFRKKHRDPLACKEDANSTTDMTEGGGEDIYPARSHFSITSLRQSPRIITASDTFYGDEGIEIEWPCMFETGEDLANSLQQYFDRRDDSGRSSKHNKRTPVDFDQLHPSDSKSVGSAALAVSFDNREECAQLVFQSHSTSSDDTDILPLGAGYSHPAAPKAHCARRRQNFDWQHSQSPCYDQHGPWDELAQDTPIDVLAEASSGELARNSGEEVLLTDYENNAAWSYDDASFSSLLGASSNLFQPICRPDTYAGASEFLFVPPSYFTGCFTHGPTLLDQAEYTDDEDDSVELTPSETSALPPPSLIEL